TAENSQPNGTRIVKSEWVVDMMVLVTFGSCELPLSIIVPINELCLRTYADWENLMVVSLGFFVSTNAALQ
ncbi:hypothetical protein J6590_026840, partial [Homalodisca vitripennis]